MTGQHATSGETPSLPLAAGESTAADRQLEADFARVTLIRASRSQGTPWARIGATQGKPPKVAKRDAKRLTARTRRAWYLQHNAEG